MVKIMMVLGRVIVSEMEGMNESGRTSSVLIMSKMLSESVKSRDFHQPNAGKSQSLVSILKQKLVTVQ